jgi:excisionase family DNA binding protein
MAAPEPAPHAPLARFHGRRVTRGCELRRRGPDPNTAKLNAICHIRMVRASLFRSLGFSYLFSAVLSRWVCFEAYRVEGNTMCAAYIAQQQGTTLDTAIKKVTDPIGDLWFFVAEFARVTAKNRLAISEIAQRLGIGRLAVYAMLVQGIIPGTRLGRRWIVTQPAYEQWQDGLVFRYRCSWFHQGKPSADQRIGFRDKGGG